MKQKLIYPAFLLYALLCFGLALIEIYKYPGIIAKFTHIDFTYFIYLLALLSVLIKKPEKHKQAFEIGTTLAIFFYLIVTLTESMTFNNFIFSRFHINIEGVPGFVSIFFVILSSYYLRKNKFMERFALIILGYWTILNLFSTLNYARSKITFQIHHPNATYDEKMSRDWGQFYDCMLVVRDNTPDDATIFIPPQSGVWQEEGNEYLVRYFLYPAGLHILKRYWRQRRPQNHTFYTLGDIGREIEDMVPGRTKKLRLCQECL